MKKVKKSRKPEKTPYVIYISPKLKAKFKAYAKKHDIFLTDLAESILSNYFKSN